MICCGAVDDKCDVCSKSTGACLNCTSNYNLVGDVCVYVNPTPLPATPAPTMAAVASDAGSTCTVDANCKSGRCRGGYCCAYDDGTGLSSEITSGRAKCIVCAAVTGMCANCSLTYSDNYRLTRDTRECKQRLQPGSKCTFDDECAPSSPYASRRNTRCLTGNCCSTWDQGCRACSEIDGTCLSCQPQARVVVSSSNVASCAARLSNGSCKTDRDCASNMCRRSTEPRDPYVGWKQACCAPKVDPNCFVCNNIDGKCANCTTNYHLVGDKCVHIATPAPTPVPVASDAGNNCTKNEGCATGRCRGGFCCAYDDGTLAKYKDEPLMRGRVQCTACASGTGLCTTCTPHNFVTNNASECARELGAGRVCSANRDCESGACRGGYCCHTHIAITNCSLCTSTGFCSNCTVGCTDCDEPVGMCDACAASYQLQNWTCTGTGATTSPSPSGQSDTIVPAPSTMAVQPTTSPADPSEWTTPAPTSNGTRAPLGPSLSGSAVFTFTFTDDSLYDKAKFDAGMQSLLGADPSQYTVIQTGPTAIEVRFTGSNKVQLAQKLETAMESDVDVTATLGAATVSMATPTPAPTAVATPAADENGGLPTMYIAIVGGSVAVIVIGAMVGCVLMKRNGSADSKSQEAEDVRQITVYEKNPETPGDAQCRPDEAAV